MVRIAVVIPAGVGDDVADTVSSVLHYLPGAKLFIVNDTGGSLRGESVVHPDVRIVDAPRGAPGGLGGLWVKLARGYRAALSDTDFDVLVRLDADALVVGYGLAVQAHERFTKNPNVGMLGSYRVGPDGHLRNWSPARRKLLREISPIGLSKPGVYKALRKLVGTAEGYGYVYGEHCLGGCYIQSRKAVELMEESDLLAMPHLSRSRLGEDHLFALITRSVGLLLDDFGGPADPLALAWRGLPMPPAELVKRKKLVTHSVRRFGVMSEQDIRSYFSAIRADHAQNPL